jgi:hypothetical protein
MKVHEFLAHHGIQEGNPFAEEDAQTDVVFKEHCVDTTFHPAWDKINGSPGEPATSVVFGEKGSGKTALRLQLGHAAEGWNEAHPERRVLVVPYVEFNQTLDLLFSRGGGDDRVLASWRIQDHMDAILSVAVSKVGAAILEDREGPTGVPQKSARSLDHGKKRDLLLLFALYGGGTSEPFRTRFSRLARRLRFSTLLSRGWAALAILITVAALSGAGYLHFVRDDRWLSRPWPWVVAAAGWLPWAVKWMVCMARGLQVTRDVRVVMRRPSDLAWSLARLGRGQVESRLLPTRRRPDARYELLSRFLEVLEALRFHGMLVLVDRVDEPSRISGSADKMRRFVWPLLDSKLLSYPRVGFKLLLPLELSHFLPTEDRSFHDRARLDKLNLIRSLDWTGQALYDLANDRLTACSRGVASEGGKLRELFEETLPTSDLVNAFEKLRVPRHLFKFLYRLITDHCHAHGSDFPSFQIGAATFQATLAVYLRDLRSLDAGIAVG